MSLQLASCSTDHFLLLRTGGITCCWNCYSRMGGPLGIANQEFSINAQAVWLLNKRQPFLCSSNSALWQ